MSKVWGNRVIAGTSSLVLTALLVACGGDVDPASQKGLVLAQATPGEVTEPVKTTADSSTPPAEIRVKPTNVAYTDAESVFRKGRYQEAAELFTVYVEENPRDGFGQYMLGLSAWKSGDRGKAEAALVRAVEMDGENVKVRTNLGRVLLEQGRAVDALPHVEKAVELRPESPETWRVLGNVKAELGRSEDALEAYRQALLLNEKDAWSINNYGLVLIQLGRHEEAMQPLARAVELTPGSPVFQNNLGIALERSGYLGGARKAFSTAMAADSTYVKAKISLERVQKRLGETEGESIDLSALARGFMEEVQRWRTPDPAKYDVQ